MKEDTFKELSDDVAVDKSNSPVDDDPKHVAYDSSMFHI
jgi:hypothetical protein